VLLDRRLQVPAEARIFSSEARTLVIALKDEAEPVRISQLEARGVEVVTTGESGGGHDLVQVFKELHRRRVLSVMVEGGSRLSAALVRAGIVDKYYVFIAPKLFGGDGLASFGALDVVHPEYAVKLRFDGVRRFGSDILLEAYPED
jgi:diaminohydroxyphosphoribosylaminopyrimidine deaminase/5-amino-6-(5-phosphoribosylamino)uracil reductase